MTDAPQKIAVTITDIKVPFWSVVNLVLQIAIASVPVALILAVLLAMFTGLLTGILAPR